MIKTSVIGMTEVGKDDVILVNLGVGNMPLLRITEYMATVRESLRETFPNRRVLVLPKPGQYESNLEILRFV